MIMSRMTRLSGVNLTLLKAEAQRFGFYPLALGDDLCLSGIALTQQREKCEKLLWERDREKFLKRKRNFWFLGFLVRLSRGWLESLGLRATRRKVEASGSNLACFGG